MPRGDRTGPRGEGPRTGRGMGYCSGFNSPGYTKGTPRGGGGFGRGAGFGRGPGRGFGFGRGFAGRANPASYWGGTNYGQATQSEEEAKQSEKQYLENEIEALEQELEAMKNRMRELGEQGENRGGN